METVSYEVPGAVFGWVGLLVPLAMALVGPAAVASSWSRGVGAWREGALVTSARGAAAACGLSVAIGAAAFAVLTSPPSQRSLAERGPEGVDFHPEHGVLVTSGGERCRAVLEAERDGIFDPTWEVTVVPLAICERVEPEVGEAAVLA